MKTALEGMLNSELDVHFGRSELAAQGSSDASDTASPGQRKNHRNGHSPKTVQGELGKLPIGNPARLRWNV